MANCDVVVCGVGAMGSAALYHLARRGLHVIGIEQAHPGHEGGSSHGRTRMFRLSYFEHPSYVPLLRRAQALWRELEHESKRPLLHRTGILEIGAAGGRLVQSTLAAARLHDLPHDVLDARELMRKNPMFAVPNTYVAVRQPDGGLVESDAAIAAMVALARQHGATLATGERIRRIVPRRRGVSIITDRRSVFARKAIVTAGAWLPQLLPDMALPLRVTRQVLAWFRPKEPLLFANGRCPVFLIESRHGLHYGIPFAGEPGVKLAKHHHADQEVDPNACDRTVSFQDVAMIRSAIAALLPAADGPVIASKTCLYTMTPDHDFIIDRHPDCANILFASPCSGHGFKFAPVVGEILADLATGGGTTHDISRFQLARFAEAT
jgi:sarcosine oxidase